MEENMFTKPLSNQLNQRKHFAKYVKLFLNNESLQTVYRVFA